MIGILCSALGLGTYVPGLLIREELAAAGVESRVLVFESFLGKEQREAIVKARRAYQRNVALVRIGQKLIPRMHADTAIDRNAVRDAMDRSEISHLIVLTGFWIPILVELAAVRSFSTDLLHIDAILSPSWEAVRERGADVLRARDIWLGNLANGRLDHAIEVDCVEIPFAERQNAIVAHGGGWALGAYKEATSGIAEAGYGVHVVLPAQADPPSWAASVLRVDPQWEVWGAPGRLAAFPPLVGDGFLLNRGPDRHYHDLLEVCRRTKGVVSKPGGATILDCIAAATPLICIEPQGDHEAANATLWTSLGLAIRLDDWARASFSDDVLYQLHLNLRRVRARTPSYVRERLLGPA